MSVPGLDDLVACWLRNLGLPIVARRMKWREADEPSKGCSMFLAGWVADYPDPHNYLRDFAGLFLRWRDESFVRLADEASATAQRAKRMRLYARAERLMIEQAVVVPLVYIDTHRLLKPRVRPYPMSAMRRAFLEDASVEEA